MNYFQKANNYYTTADYEKAIDMYKKAYSFFEGQSTALYNTGVCYIKLTQYEKALFYLKKAVLINEESKYFFNIGYCYYKLDNYKKALQNFNIAWTLNNYDNECEKAINMILCKYKK